ncbi:MAG: 2-oxo acid dehydrogenase subunit E2 [Bdellovibrionales bacterium]
MNKPLTVPRLNPNDNEVELAVWHKKTGDKISVGDPICDFATTKAAFIFEAESEGYLKQKAAKSARLSVGDVFAEICASVEEAQKVDVKPAAAASIATTFTRKALQKMRELGLSRDDFQNHAFVTEKTVLERTKGGAGGLSILKEAEIAALNMSGAALRSSLTMLASAKTLKDISSRTNVSVQAYIAWATAQTLQEKARFLNRFPASESTKTSVDLGYALDMGTGTRSFLAKDCQTWSAERWGEQVVDWGMRLLRNQIRLEELGSGDFTLTDLSSEGIFSFEPLLVAGQSAILGVAGELGGGEPRVSLTLSFDHRVHDGRQAAQFLKAMRAKIENPQS